MSIRFFSIPLKKIIRFSMLALATTVALTTVEPSRSIASGYQWDHVSIGGGGYVTNIYLHPLEQNLAYIRTDIGGFYRWNSLEKRWIPLIDHFTYDQSNYYGGEGLALDPNNPNIVYIAAGKYTASWAGLGTIFKSTNKGQT